MNLDTLSTPAALIAGIMLVALNAYLLSGGADFGGGIWDLLATRPRRERQRELIADSIGPVWEVNHVWLILVVVLLFSSFPPAFATISVELHVPMTLLLMGIVLRGSAFTFRTYDDRRSAVRRRWGLLFSISSIWTPAWLGVCAGAIASGAVSRAARLQDPSFVERFIQPWANPFVLGVGLMVLSLCAFLAAVYLTVEAGDDRELQEDFRLRALAAAGAVFGTAFVTLATARRHAPNVMDTMGDVRVSYLLHALTALAATLAILALVRRQYRRARVYAAAQVSFILWGWAFSTWPWILPPELTFAAAAAPKAVLELILVALLLGAVVLFPSLAYLLRLFKRDPAMEQPLHDDTGEHHAEPLR